MATKATNRYSSSNGSKVTLATALLKAFPGATNPQIHAVLSTAYGSSVRNSTLASIRRTAGK